MLNIQWQKNRNRNYNNFIARNASDLARVVHFTGFMQVKKIGLMLLDICYLVVKTFCIKFVERKSRQLFIKSDQAMERIMMIARKQARRRLGTTCVFLAVLFHTCQQLATSSAKSMHVLVKLGIFYARRRVYPCLVWGGGGVGWVVHGTSAFPLYVRRFNRRSQSTLDRKLWVFSRRSGFLSQRSDRAD